MKINSIANDNSSSVYMSSDVVDSLLNGLKKSNTKFHQFYNTEISTAEFGYIKYMDRFKNNTKTKRLNKTYYDIETYVDELGTFTDPVKVIEAVNSIALYNNIKNKSYIICFITDCKLQDHDEIKSGVLKTYKEACLEKKDYIVKDMEIEIIICNTEQILLETFFTIVREQNTLMLIGFNSSQFDDAYVINRLREVVGETSMQKIISEFGIVKQYNEKTYDIPDYLLVDLLKLYKPVGSGGGGLGKSLPDFKLNTICKKELGLEKLDMSLGFREAYLTDIIGYLAYNLLDTILTYKLDEKLQFMELTFDLCKYNNSTMGAAITGRSFIYSYRNDLMYYRNKQLIRTKKFAREVLYEPKIHV